MQAVALQRSASPLLALYGILARIHQAYEAHLRAVAMVRAERGAARMDAVGILNWRGNITRAPHISLARADECALVAATGGGDFQMKMTELFGSARLPFTALRHGFHLGLLVGNDRQVAAWRKIAARA